MLVLTEVSSMNTRLDVSSKPCSLIQRRRARATSARSCSAARRLFFLKLMSWRSRNRQSVLRLPGIPHLRMASASSSSILSGCSLTSVRSLSVWSSRGERLPPHGLGAHLPSRSQDCSHLTAELALTSNRSAASRREAPSPTAAITRSRKSAEQALGIGCLIKPNPSPRLYPSVPLGNPDSNPPETALILTTAGCANIVAR